MQKWCWIQKSKMIGFLLLSPPKTFFSNILSKNHSTMKCSSRTWHHLKVWNRWELFFFVPVHQKSPFFTSFLTLLWRWNLSTPFPILVPKNSWCTRTNWLQLTETKSLFTMLPKMSILFSFFFFFNFFFFFLEYQVHNWDERKKL